MLKPNSSYSSSYQRWYSEYSAYTQCKAEFCSRASAALLGADRQKLSAWNPYGDERLLFAVRESRLAMLGMILADLDGFEPPSLADVSQERKGEVISLVNEARTALVETILGLPEVLLVAGGCNAGKQLSVGGYGKSGISLYMTVPEDISAKFFIPGIEPESLSCEYWLLEDGATHLAQILGTADAQGDTELAKLIRLKYAETYSDGVPTSFKRWDGTEIPNFTDAEIPSQHEELIDEVLGCLADIEALYPLYNASFASLANICYDISGIAPENRPDWALQ